jgi:hypothetical protein
MGTARETLVQAVELTAQIRYNVSGQRSINRKTLQFDMSDDFDPYLDWLGIDPEERPADHYRLLGIVRFESRFDAIRAAADQRMSHVRKYQTGPKSLYTQKVLNDLAAARLCLLDPSTKASYDAALRAKEAAARPGPRPATHAGGPVSPSSPLPQRPPQQATIPQPHPGVSAGMPTGIPLTAGPAAPGDVDDEESKGTISPIVWIVAGAVGLLFLAAGALSALLVLGWSGDDDSSQEEDPVQVIEHAVKELPPVESIPDAGPDVQPVLVWPEAGGEVNLSAPTAVLRGGLRLAAQGGEEAITSWQSPDCLATWRFKILDPGMHRVQVWYAVTQDADGAVFAVAIGDEQHSHTVSMRGGPGAFITDEFFMAIRRTGEHTLMCWPETPTPQGLMQLRSIRLSKP